MFSPIKISILILAISMTLLSCAPKEQISPNVRSGESLRHDGSTIYWSLSSSNTDHPKGILLIAQGSGCASALTSSNVQQLMSKTTDLSVLIIEKYGVKPDDAPNNPMEDCSDTFFEHHTVSQRVDDAVSVLDQLSDDGDWNGKLALFGGSEGGAVVSILSHKVEETDAVIVFSTGTGTPLSEMILQIIPPTAVPETREQFTHIRANPQSTEKWGGNTFKWWADIMDTQLSDELLISKAPVLIVHGVLDKNAPVSSARATKSAFLKANDTRLTYWELDDRGHQMKDAQGISHMSSVLDDVSNWIGEQIK